MSADNKLEKEQATLRMVVIFIVFCYAFFVVYIDGMSGDVSRQLFKYGVFYASASIILCVFVVYGVDRILDRRDHQPAHGHRTDLFFDVCTAA